MASSEEDESPLMVKEERDDLAPSWRSQISSAFAPYRNMTILTNLQRGNIETQSCEAPPENYTFHIKAAMGEVTKSDFTPDLNIDELDGHSLSPLMWAAFYGQQPTVRLLIQHNASVDIQGIDGETALLLASSGGHHEVCQLLLNCGADPNHTDLLGRSALMFAAFSDRAHCVAALLEGGADLTTTASDGSTAFAIATRSGRKRAQIVMERFLLRALEPS